MAEVPAPETASQLLPRFMVRQLQAVAAELARDGVELDRMLGRPQNDPVTLDLDSTPTEVYGGQKEDATYNYEGKRSLGSLFCTWAEQRRVVAAQLRSGSASDKPIFPAVVQRALRTLPQGHGEVRLRADSGFHSVPFLNWCRRHGLGFCVAVPPLPDDVGGETAHLTDELAASPGDGRSGSGRAAVRAHRLGG